MPWIMAALSMRGLSVSVSEEEAGKPVVVGAREGKEEEEEEEADVVRGLGREVAEEVDEVVGEEVESGMSTGSVSMLVSREDVVDVEVVSISKEDVVDADVVSSSKGGISFAVGKSVASGSTSREAVPSPLRASRNLNKERHPKMSVSLGILES